MADNATGGCQCGAVRFEAAGAPRFVANCHCRSCRKATGAAFSTWVGYTDDRVRMNGAAAYYVSSPGVRRGFCPHCGTPLSYAGDQWPGETHFLIGAFDDPARFTPQGDAFAGEALGWTQTFDVRQA